MIRNVGVIVEVVFAAIRHIRSSSPKLTSTYQQSESGTTRTVTPMAPLTEDFLPSSNPSFKDRISLSISYSRNWHEINRNPAQEGPSPNSKTMERSDPYSGYGKGFTVTSCPILEVPREVLNIFLRQLDDQSLLAVQATCKSLESLVEPVSKHYLETCLGFELAQKLKQKRPNWNRLMRDIYSPIKTKSTRLAVVKKTTEGDPVLRINSDHDCEKLRFILERLDSDDKYRLNEVFKYTDNDSLLKIAAKNGFLKKAQLLIDFGVLDALYISHTKTDHLASTTSTKTGHQSPTASCSALLTAATYAQVDMVRLLLEHGALPDLNVEFIRDRARRGLYNPTTDGYQTLLAQLILDISTLNFEIGFKTKFQDPFNPDILWCIILIVNAWRSKIGANLFCQNKDAKTILNQAVKDQNLNVANILMSFGLRPDKDKVEFDQLALDAIRHHRLHILMWLHQHQLYDLVQARDENGRTLLYTAKCYDNELAIQFLRKIKVPTDLVGPDGKSDLDAGKVKLDELLRRDIFNRVIHWGRSGEFEMLSRTSRLKYYLKQGLDLNIPVTEFGNTILHAVALDMRGFVRMDPLSKEESVQYIKTLLIYGADPRKKNKEDLTPLDLLQETLRDYTRNYPHFAQDVTSIIQLMQEFKT